MKTMGLLFLFIGLLVWSAAAQTASTETQGSVSGQASVNAEKGTQAQSSTSVSASQGASVANRRGKTENRVEEQQKTAQSSGATGSVAAGSTVQAVLSKPVDAKKAREGDEVAAKTTSDLKSEGKVVVPKGSRLIGHVTQVKAHSKGEAESALGIAFDKAVLKGGQEVPLHAAIQAIAAAETKATAAPMEDSMTSASAAENTRASAAGSRGNGGGLVGSTVNSAAGTLNGATTAATHTTADVGSAAGGTLGAGANAAGRATGARLNSASSGVVGLQGLALKSDASNSAQGSVITSKDRNVHLESGTQMLLRVTSE